MSVNENHTIIPAELAEIAPYGEHEFHDKLASLVKEPGFEHAVRYVMPDVDYEAFCNKLLSVKSQKEFQIKVMGDFLTFLEKSTTEGVSVSGLENIDKNSSHTFLSNHRDIVLDASFLNLCMLRNELPVTQVAIGNNLLIYDWITDLVKINRSFIVKRDVKKLEALDAAKKLSSYIHFAVTQQKESVWIAQREGRAKDSNDVTQESLMKMLSFAGDGDTQANLLELNILPTSISYEYDPNDYLKVREFLMKRRDPNFKKSQRDDLLSMETGLLKPKGRVHFHIGKCINEEYSKYTFANRIEAVHQVCAVIDKSIHQGYYFYPCNYIAYDALYECNKFSDKYTDEDVAKFKEYANTQLSKVEVDNITDDEHEFMHKMLLTMYSNPVKNQLAAQE
jgi:hypothetical protein